MLLDILIFLSDASQSLFILIICYIQLFHWLIILSNNLFGFGELNFFQLQNRKTKSSARKRNYCVSSGCPYAKLKIFVTVEKLLKWTPAFIDRIEKIVNSYK